MYDFDVKFKKLNEFAKEPYHASEDAAGYDLFAAIPSPVTIEPDKVEKISTGIAISLPRGTFGAIFARSGLAIKKGLAPMNKVGVIDADYRGDCIVALHNESSEPQTICTGDRIAQLVVLPYVSVNFIETNDLDETERGDGGFGHSGT